MAKTTELEGVNEILMSAGISEVADLGASTLANVDEANQAYNVLQRIDREIQSGGLHCNVERRVVLSPVANEITIDSDILRVDPSNYRYPEICMRDDKLYNLTDQTSTFTSDVTVDLVRQIPFEDLPEHVRRYIVIRSTRVFVLRYTRDTELYQALREDELHARQQFNTGEIQNSDTNMLDGYPANRFRSRAPVNQVVY